MSEEQLSAFLAALKADTGLQEKLKGATDFDAALASVQEAGFDVSKADWIKYQGELSDEELEEVAGGNIARFGKSIFKSIFDKEFDCANRC
jgi:predicted ribosomally synthesized peptide with nif11-like leader